MVSNYRYDAATMDKYEEFISFIREVAGHADFVRDANLPREDDEEFFMRTESVY